MTMKFGASPGLTTPRYPIKLDMSGRWPGALCACRRPVLGGWGALFHEVVPRRGVIPERRNLFSLAVRRHGRPCAAVAAGGCPTSRGVRRRRWEDGTEWTPGN